MILSLAFNALNDIFLKIMFDNWKIAVHIINKIFSKTLLNITKLFVKNGKFELVNTCIWLTLWSCTLV